MSVRPCSEDDWPRLKSLRLAALLDAPLAFGLSYATAAAYTEAQWRERAAGRTAAEYWLAFAQDEAVGLIGGAVGADGQYQLIAMWLRPDRRGAGLAGRLVDAVTARAAAGHARVVLGVAPDNDRAVGLYRKHGFAFLPEWETLDSHPGVTLQKMAWLAPSA